MPVSKYAVRELGQTAANGLLSFTKWNFKSNLARHTGINPANHHAHHVIPQQFAKHPLLVERGINVHDPRFGVWVDKSLHKQIHIDGYNRDWTNFLKTNRSYEDILDFGRELMSRYGIISLNM